MWYHKNKIFNPTNEELSKFAGFVYIITNKKDNKKYVGKKTFWSKKTLSPLKGKSRKRRFTVESNWKEYYGSSETVNQILLESGSEIFHREILYLCKTKGEMSYLEAKCQFDMNVLLDDSFYNGIIQCKIHRSHVQSLKDED